MSLVDEETLAWARECYVAGDGVASIAADTGVGEAEWRRILNIRTPDLTDPRRPRNLRILTSWNDGLSTTEIAAAEQLSATAIRDIVQKMRLEGEEAPRRAPGRLEGRPHKPRPLLPYTPRDTTPKPDRNVVILAEWVAGRSAREIARKVGCSRNAALGVVWRANQARISRSKPALRIGGAG